LNPPAVVIKNDEHTAEVSCVIEQVDPDTVVILDCGNGETLEEI
jgi:hypothetical protein